MPDSNWMMCMGNSGFADVACILKQQTKCLNENIFLKVGLVTFFFKERMFVGDVYG